MYRRKRCLEPSYVLRLTSVCTDVREVWNSLTSYVLRLMSVSADVREVQRLTVTQHVQDSRMSWFCCFLVPPPAVRLEGWPPLDSGWRAVFGGSVARAQSSHWGQPGHGGIMGRGGGTFRMGMCLLGAPQLSEQINQMIDKAKHHWCNSRIDKCCSLRLIQRQCNQSLSTMTAAAYSK